MLATVLAPPSAHALILFRVKETNLGVEIRATTDGDVSLGNLTAAGTATFNNDLVFNPFVGEIGTGSTGTLLRSYTGFSPSNTTPVFGSIDNFYPGASTASDPDAIYFAASTNEILMPEGFTSSQIIDTTTVYGGTTLATLGLLPGMTYDWTWGGQLENETFRIQVEPVPAPLPLLGGAAAFGWSRRLRRRVRAAKLKSLTEVRA